MPVCALHQLGVSSLRPVVISQLCSLGRFQQQQQLTGVLRKSQVFGTAAAGAVAGRAAVVARASSSSPSGGGGSDGDDFSVFRFTLGIPGFKDRLVPRVVGLLGLTLLAANHVLGANPAPEAQVRAEYLGAALAAVAFLAPDIEARLAEVQPGRGRAAAAGAVKGGANAFALTADLPDEQRKELAWASFALLKNTNSCSVLVWKGGKALMARGQVAESLAAAGSAQGILQELTQAAARMQASPKLAAVVAGSEAGAYFQDAGSMAAAGMASWGWVPEGAASAVVQRLEPVSGAASSRSSSSAGNEDGLLVVLCDRPRALSTREKQWVAAVAAKLAGSLQS